MNARKARLKRRRGSDCTGSPTWHQEALPFFLSAWRQRAVPATSAYLHWYGADPPSSLSTPAPNLAAAPRKEVIFLPFWRGLERDEERCAKVPQKYHHWCLYACTQSLRQCALTMTVYLANISWVIQVSSHGILAHSCTIAAQVRLSLYKRPDLLAIYLVPVTSGHSILRPRDPVRTEQSPPFSRRRRNIFPSHTPTTKTFQMSWKARPTYPPNTFRKDSILRH